MVDLGEDEEVFARFMTPLSAAFNHLKNALSDSNVNPQTPQSVSSNLLIKIFCQTTFLGIDSVIFSMCRLN